MAKADVKTTTPQDVSFRDAYADWLNARANLAKSDANQNRTDEQIAALLNAQRRQTGN